MYSKIALLAATRVGQLCRNSRSSLSVEKKLSATALSQQLPGRLRLDRMPWLSSTPGRAIRRDCDPRTMGGRDGCPSLRHDTQLEVGHVDSR